MEGRRLVLARRRWEESLGVFGEVLATVRRVETLWKDDERCAGFGSLENLRSSMLEVCSFIGTCTIVVLA